MRRKGHAGACHSRGHPIRGQGGVHEGTEGHPVATGPSPSPFNRAALYVRERGAQGHATPGPTRPVRVERARRPLPLGVPAPYVRRGSMRGHAIPDATPFAGKGGAQGHQGTPRHHRPLPFPLRPRRPVRVGKGRGRAREGKPPHPVAPHSHGKGRTRLPASLRVVGAGTVSARPRPSRPHTVFARHCTT
ncbi:hypothetical protein EDB85DRAFT_1886373 [Lactarius pseudohatsudake]|nr:hypothetical protein EDB85DRAFT_1886373 [Lactarius pseudohatsudake]